MAYMSINRENPDYMNYIGQLEDMIDDRVCPIPIQTEQDYLVVHYALERIQVGERFDSDLLFGEIAQTEHAEDLQERIADLEEVVDESDMYVRSDLRSAENTETVRQIFRDQIGQRACEMVNEERRALWIQEGETRREAHAAYLESIEEREAPAEGSAAHVLSLEEMYLEWELAFQAEEQREIEDPLVREGLPLWLIEGASSEERSTLSHYSDRILGQLSAESDNARILFRNYGTFLRLEEKTGLTQEQALALEPERLQRYLCQDDGFRNGVLELHDAGCSIEEINAFPLEHYKVSGYAIPLVRLIDILKTGISLERIGQIDLQKFKLLINESCYVKQLAKAGYMVDELAVLELKHLEDVLDLTPHIFRTLQAYPHKQEILEQCAGPGREIVHSGIATEFLRGGVSFAKMLELEPELRSRIFEGGYKAYYDFLYRGETFEEVVTRYQA